jgi:hypothetical protein
MKTKFWSGALRERDHSGDLGVDVRMMMEWILGEVGWRSVDWVYLDQWQDLVSTVVGLQVP